MSGIHYSPNGNIPIKCLLCGSDFSQKEELDLHLSKGCNHTPTLTLIEQLDTNYSLVLPQHDQSFYGINLEQVHFEEFIFNFPNDSAAYLEDRKFVCKACCKRFKQKHHLKRHLNTCVVLHEKIPLHTSVEARVFCCNLCLRQFKRKEHLQKHIINCKNRYNANHMNGVNTSTYPCELCNRTFFRKSSLQRHLATVCRRTDNKNSSFICFLCGSNFATKDILIRHLYSTNKHARISQNVFQCVFCYLKFVRRDRFHAHLKRHLANDSQHQCTSCHTQFESSWLLLRHKSNRKLSNKENNISCCICKATFISQDDLEKHLNVKEGEKDMYICFVCDTVYMLKNDLILHVLLKHSQKEDRNVEKNIVQSLKISDFELNMEGEPLVCNVCNYVLLNRQSFNLHMQIHDNENIVDDDI